MKRIILPALAAGMALAAWTETNAATAYQWSGRGAFPCDENCSTEWGLDEAARFIPAETMVEMRRLVASTPAQPLSVHDGTVFSGMAYYRDGEAQMQPRTIARLDAPEPAYGWTVDGWTFGRIVTCNNLAIWRSATPSSPHVVIVSQSAGTSSLASAGAYSGGGAVGLVATGSGGGGGSGGGTVVATPVDLIIDPVEPVQGPISKPRYPEPLPDVQPSPVPLPGSAFFLLAALMGLFGLRLRA